MRPSTDREAITLILEGLVEQGCRLTAVEDDTWNPDELVAVHSTEGAVDTVNAVDQAYVYLMLPNREQSWVLFVLGNDPEDVACDYNINLSQYIEPITRLW